MSIVWLHSFSWRSLSLAVRTRLGIDADRASHTRRNVVSRRFHSLAAPQNLYAAFMSKHQIPN